MTVAPDRVAPHLAPADRAAYRVALAALALPPALARTVGPSHTAARATVTHYARQVRARGGRALAP